MQMQVALAALSLGVALCTHSPLKMLVGKGTHKGLKAKGCGFRVWGLGLGV